MHTFRQNDGSSSAMASSAGFLPKRETNWLLILTCTKNHKRTERRDTIARPCVKLLVFSETLFQRMVSILTINMLTFTYNDK